MRFFSLWLLFLCSAICAEENQAELKTPKDWKQIDKGVFTFTAPPDIKESLVKGIDSYVGEFETEHWWITFDYGSWSNSMKEMEYQHRDVTVDGRKGYLATKKGHLGLYLPDVNPPARGEKHHLSMLVIFKKESDINTQAETLLRSLKFVKPQAP